MSKTTITICGEECVILPAPKGAFINREGMILPCFVEYAAIATNDSSIPNIYGIGLMYNNDFVEIQDKRNGEKLKSEIFSIILDEMYNSAIEGGEDDMRDYVIDLYQAFKSHGTPMDISAIEWFREKFKEHNITKADFDVFA